RDCGELYHYLIERKFQTGREVLGLDLAGSTLLEICAGSGLMPENFSCAGAIVTATDFRAAAVLRAHERARRSACRPSFAVADARWMPLRADRLMPQLPAFPASLRTVVPLARQTAGVCTQQKTVRSGQPGIRPLVQQTRAGSDQRLAVGRGRSLSLSNLYHTT